MRFKHSPLELTYGELVCETLPTGRTYVTPEGKKYPSITTVLSIHSKDTISEWRQRVGEEEANRVSRVAAGRGGSAHTLLERYLNNEEVVKEGNMPNAWASFQSVCYIFDQRVGTIYLQEKPLYSDHLGVAGRVDLVAEFDGKPSIVDLKTSSRVKTEEDIHTYFMQEAAYAIMVEERTGKPITQLVTVMAVDFAEPIVFIQKRDKWTGPLLDTIKEYRRQKLYGHI
jgi:hypothetical protein